MVLLRKLLFPFAILYGLVTQLRNMLYDNGIFRSYRFDVPIIAVGNLSVGGTGKSPQVEYLIRLLSEKYRVAVLSRGYKRKSEGFILADDNASAELLGDEPFQIHRKFPNIDVAVDADRKNGVEKLLSKTKKPEVILLDDAYQHRKVKAGFYILLTAYGDLYADDFLLPTGNLREGRKGAERAEIVIVTKCPPGISNNQQDEIRVKLKINNRQQLYFTVIQYDDFVYSNDHQIDVDEIRREPKLLLAGIAKPQPFFAYLQRDSDIIMAFPDHHHFSGNDIQEILRKAAGKRIITTEKDFVRLSGIIASDRLFYLPIKSEFISGAENFDKTILNFVGTSI